MSATQLDFFRSEDEVTREDILKVKKDLTTIRRGTFATMGELHKHILNLQNLYESLKDDIDRIETLLIKAKDE